MSKQQQSRTVVADAADESFIVIGGHADAGLILLCDHAGNAFPPGYGTLGLPEGDLARHIAYDIGAAALVNAIAAALGVPAVLTRYSRLLIDPNRGNDDPTQIMRLSDGAIIPGNRHLDETEQAKRRRLYYEPYHQAIGAVIDACLATGATPTLLSIHSFTESWKGVPRPWHVGILWDHDQRLARPLIEGFMSLGELIVGDNEPYKGSLEGDCLWRHGTSRGLPNAIIEVRQDLIRDAAGQQAWARRIIGIIEGLCDRPDLQLRLRPEHMGAFPSRSSEGATTMPKPIEARIETELQAAAYRKLVEHLRNRTDVQNIDLMNLAGFCRNCLANWLQEAAGDKGVALSKDEAREIVYGMPYKDWQAKHQKDASAEQKAAYEKSKPHNH
jgi:predicted N-formylglutamate amidohydrolase